MLQRVLDWAGAAGILTGFCVSLGYRDWNAATWAAIAGIYFICWIIARHQATHTCQVTAIAPAGFDEREFANRLADALRENGGTR